MGLIESKNIINDAVHLTYGRGRYRLGHVVALVLVLAACSSDKPATSGTGATPGQDGGESGTAGSGSGTAGGTSAAAGRGGNAGNGVAGSGASGNSACPSGTSCTAPAGALVCTLASTGYPPTCSSLQPCTFGTCLPYAGQNYCMQSCGPTAVDTCAAGSQCINPTGTYLTPQGDFFCSILSTNLPPICTGQQDCAYGDCVTYGTTKSCMLPCKKPQAAACPTGAECSVVSYNTVCVKPDTVLPPSCTSQTDCTYGNCLQTQGKGYCVQYCDKPVYRITGLVKAYSGTDLVNVADVDVCNYDYTNNKVSTPCTKSLADGTFVLKNLPDPTSSVYYVLSLKKAGYVSTLRLSYAFEEQTELTATLLYTDAQMKAAVEAAGGTFPDAANGFITFFGTMTSNGTLVMLDSFTAKLDPARGTGPLYLSSTGTVDKTLTKASTAGWGSYVNVPPGTYKMTFTHPTLNCGDASSVLVAAGYVSANVPAYCQ